MPARSALITAAAFAEKMRPGEELVRGKIVRSKPADPRHGELCRKAKELASKAISAGRIVASSSAITHQNPDTVRVADLAFYPDDQATLPEWVIEVRKQEEPWPDVLARVVEYHSAGVQTICILDDPSKSAHVYGPDRLPKVFRGEESVEFSGFLIKVAEFFG